MKIFTWKVKFIIKSLIVIGTIIALGITAGENTPDSIKPGEGFSNSSVRTRVEARDSVWTASRASISADTKEINFTISGSVFLCGRNQDSIETETIRVSANNANPVDTGIKVSEGEYVKFKLTPFQRELTSCDAIAKEHFAFDEDGKFKNRNGRDLQQKDVCNGTELYQGGELVGSTSDYKNEYSKPSDNSDNWSIEGNKWLRATPTGVSPMVTPWFKGTFMDFRISEEQSLNPLSGFNCTDTIFNTDVFYKKFESELVNKKCNRYSRDGGPVFSYHIRKNSRQQIERDSEGRTFEFADGLVSRIRGNSNSQCLNGSGNFTTCSSTIDYSTPTAIETSSLRLNYDYLVPNGIKNNSLLVGINDETIRYSQNKGGYNLEITHSCVKNEGENLYIYVGDDPTTVRPGDPGTRLVGKAQDGKYKFVNNSSGPGDSLNTSGKIFFIIKDNMDGPNSTENYSNNRGYYKIDFSINRSPTWISEALNFLVSPLKKIIFNSSVVNPGDKNPVIDGGASFTFYHNLMSNGQMRRIVYALLILYVVVVSLGFLLGIVELKTDQIFMILLKIGSVSTLLRDDSWNILNKYIFNIFWYGADSLIGKFVDFYNDNGIGGYKYDASFNFLDKTLGVIFAWENIIKFISLFFLGFSNPLAWALFVALTYAFLDMIKGCFKGILLYCIAIIINGFLVGLAPIFLCFLLFKITFRFFDSWIKQLIGNMISLVFYFVAMGMLNEILHNLIYQIFNFGAYKDCVVPISVGALKKCLVYFPMPFAANVIVAATAGGGNTGEAMSNIMPISIPVVICFVVFSKCMHIIIDVVKSLPISIFGASMMYSAMDVMDATIEGAKFGIGQDRASIDRRKRAISNMSPETDKKTRTNPISPVSATTNNKPPEVSENTPPSFTPPLPTPPDGSPVPTPDRPANNWNPPTSPGAYEAGYNVGDISPEKINPYKTNDIPSGSASSASTRDTPVEKKSRSGISPTTTSNPDGD